MKRIANQQRWSRTTWQFLTRVVIIVVCCIGLSLATSSCEQLADRLGLKQPTEIADEANEADNQADDVVEPVESPRVFEPTDEDDFITSSPQPDDTLQPRFTPEPRVTSAPATPAPVPSATSPTNTAPQNDQLVLRKIIVSTDGRSQIAVPEDWQQEFTLHPTASLQAYALLDQLYFIALADSNFNAVNSTLDSRASRYLQQFTESLSRTEAVGRTNVRQISRYPAIQYQLQAELDGVPITYLHTTVDTPFGYYQLLTWTLRSQFPAYQEELQLVTQSFDLRSSRP